MQARGAPDVTESGLEHQAEPKKTGENRIDPGHPLEAGIIRIMIRIRIMIGIRIMSTSTSSSIDI